MIETPILDIYEKQNVVYCIPEWLRDEQITHALRRSNVGRIECQPDREDAVAIVCFGPSLKKTWEQVKNFKYIITCSGAHKFLLERGIIPTWHVEVDPREHKVQLLGTPHKDVTYLPASCCHPKYFDHLEGFKVNLWHVYETNEEGLRKLPKGEWAITGGCNVGLRAMTIARFFGFLDHHIFGMDGCEGDEPGKKHAAPHPLQDGTPTYRCEYPKGSGNFWPTTPALVESARQTFHELDMMSNIRWKFYGDGLVQRMAEDYKPKPITADGKGDVMIAVKNPDLISQQYLEMNRQMHKENIFYGANGFKYRQVVLDLTKKFETTSVLDYGCGKGLLAKSLPFPIWEYDPGVPGKDMPPRAADIVVCTDVLEHIEPECLNAVLDDIRKCTNKIAFIVIFMHPSTKTLPDGRNAHLIQRPADWWKRKLKKFFLVREDSFIERPPMLMCILGKKVKVKEPVAA